jgi:hypothetical protein
MRVPCAPAALLSQHLVDALQLAEAAWRACTHVYGDAVGDTEEHARNLRA